ncbi:MAG TPA: LysR substrate-binding domain-containing protein [Actinophytocola sp.]|nr:LysR substrate-binding domain-containing protein [Actinophytocola sp.]
MPFWFWKQFLEPRTICQPGIRPRRATPVGSGRARRRPSRLFDRNNRSVKLTDAGLAFLGPCREALIAVAKAGLLARNAGTGEYGKIFPVNALREEHVILFEATPGWSIRRMVEDALDRAGVSPREVTTVSDSMTMLSFVGAGIGVGFGSLNTAALTPRQLTLVPLVDVGDVPTGLVGKSSNDTPALRTVIRAAERHLAHRPPDSSWT